MLGCWGTALLLSEKAVGPGDPGKALWQQLGALSRFKHHSEVHFCTLPLPVHTLKWAWHLPNSLNISFLQTVVPKPSFLLHSKEGGRWEATSKPFCETSHLCKAHQMLSELQVVIEAEPGCKEYFLGCKRKKTFLLPKNFLISPSKLFPCPSSTQTPEPPIAPKVAQRHWDTVHFPPQPHQPPAGLPWHKALRNEVQLGLFRL